MRLSWRVFQVGVTHFFAACTVSERSGFVGTGRGSRNPMDFFFSRVNSLSTLMQPKWSPSIVFGCESLIQKPPSKHFGFVHLGSIGGIIWGYYKTHLTC